MLLKGILHRSVAAHQQVREGDRITVPHKRKANGTRLAHFSGPAIGRSRQWHVPDLHPGRLYFENSNWGNMLFEGGAFKLDGPTRARPLASGTAFTYAYTLDSPAMIIMRIPDVETACKRVGAQHPGRFLSALLTSAACRSCPG